MENLIQQQTRIDLQRKADEQGKTGSFQGTVTSVNGATDTMGVTYGPAVEKQMPIQHPFIGTTSWIRSIPDVNTRFLMQNRMDSIQAEAIKTIPFPSYANGPNGTPVGRAYDYQNQRNVYRQLNPGEHDIASSGAALAYFGAQGNLDLRSGAHIKRYLNRLTNATEDTAPTHVRRLLQNEPGTMGDEDRVGIVKRWTTPIDEIYAQDANNNFQNEHYLQLLNPANEGPAILLSRIEGQVYDDNAVAIEQFSTTLPLRSQEFWYTTQDNFVRREIDQNGNIYMALPEDATIGYEFIIPAGNYRAEIGLNRDITIGQDEIVAVDGNIQYTVGGNVSYDVTGNYNIVTGGPSAQNAFTMDVTPGQETVGFVNSSFFGFQAENSDSGGLTSIFGPMNSGMFFNGTGQVQIQDGLGGGAIFAGPDVSLFTAGGGSLSLGDTSILSDSSGDDLISITDGEVQIQSSNNVTVVGNVFSATVGTLFLGQNAAIPAVLGLMLMAWADTHTHIAIGLGSPTSPPIIPSASLIGTPASPYSLSAFFSPNI